MSTEEALWESGRGARARYATMVLGVWLFMSGLIWHHLAVVGSLDWVLGLVVIAASILALRRPAFHWAVVGIGLWLLIQSAVLPHVQETTVWNERVVGVLLIALGAFPGSREAVRAPQK